nr:RNA-directed DNA polymerase, eukaryota [Tanacetum cinerariifolium]
MERMRMNIFNGVQDGERKIAWVKWSKVLASKKFGGLGVSSFFALNRALIFKWVLSAVLFEGAESHQLSLLTNLLDTVILSNMEDKWFFDLNGDARFCVKDVRCLLDDVFLPKAEVPTRWIKSIPIKINIFAWKLCLDRLPTRVNLAKRNVVVASLLCPLCDSGMEDAAHFFLDVIWRKM